MIDRKAVLCSAIGGVVGTVVGTFLTLAVCSVLPIGTITGGVVTCNSLRVVDEENHTKVWLDASERGGRVEVYGKAGDVRLSTNEDGGFVRVGKKGDSQMAARLDIGEHGGSVSVYGKGDSKSKVVMSVNERGNGGVSTWDRNGYRLATMK